MAAGREEDFKQVTVYLSNNHIYEEVLSSNFVFVAFVAVLKKIYCILAEFQPQFILHEGDKY